MLQEKRVVSVESEMLVKLKQSVWAPDIFMIGPPSPYFFNLILTEEDGENKRTSVGKKKICDQGGKKHLVGNWGVRGER